MKRHSFCSSTYTLCAVFLLDGTKNLNHMLLAPTPITYKDMETEHIIASAFKTSTSGPVARASTPVGQNHSSINMCWYTIVWCDGDVPIKQHLLYHILIYHCRSGCRTTKEPGMFREQPVLCPDCFLSAESGRTAEMYGQYIKKIVLQIRDKHYY